MDYPDRFDLHMHSRYSRDSLNDLKPMLMRAKQLGLRGIALTDHNTLDGFGALGKPDSERMLVIPGEEIDVDCEGRPGELIALFIQEAIPPGPLDEVLDNIREQDALSVIPHPFDRLRKHLDPTRLDKKTLGRIDAVEVLNARTVYWNEDTKKARAFATDQEKPMTGSSDAHFIGEIGRSFSRLPTCGDLEEVRTRLGKGAVQPDGMPNNPAYHAGTKIVKWLKRLF